MTDGALSGIKVVEFTEVIAGPLAGMLLADMGADVVKIEPPWGDPWRYHNEVAPAECRVFIALNRGKRSITLDLTKPEGKSTAGWLASDADVVIVNHRPDVPARLGIDYETLASKNPRLIYCDVTAYGRQGPDRDRPGYDMIIQASTGVMAAEGKVLEGRLNPATSSPFVDFSTGHTIVAQVCAALFQRERTGKVAKIETSLLANSLLLQTMHITRIESAPSLAQEWVEQDLPLLQQAGADFLELARLYHERRTVGIYRLYYRTYRTKDGAIAVGCLSDPLRKKLMDVLGLHDIRFDPGYDPEAQASMDHFEDLIRQAEAKFAERPTAEWLEALTRAGVPAGPIRFAESMVDDPQALANAMIIRQEHSVVGGVRTVGPAAHGATRTTSNGRPSPALGEHTAEILVERGMSEGEIQRLRDSGAFG